MARFIPPDLKAHLQEPELTICHLMKVMPRQPGFTPYGVTDLDANVKYDDGDGEVTYFAAVGMDMSEATSTSDLSADDAEVRSLMPVYDVPVSEEDIAAGYYDYADFVVYLINYEKPEDGHVTVLAGTFGKVKLRDDGTSIVQELRGLSAQLKQEICTKYTKTCRAVDGTMPVGSSLPGEQVKRDWCGVDFTPYIKTATVAGVGLENTLTFRVSPGDVDGDWAENFFAPGRVKFTSGRNAGRTLEILSNTADGWVTLRHETGFPIAPGDELEYRRGCSFIARDELKGCKAHAGAAWIDHFKGYPDIPTENASKLLTPGATVGPGSGGRTSDPYTDVQQA